MSVLDSSRRSRPHPASWVSPQLFSFILPLLLLPTLCRAAAVNITVDDSSSLIAYSPASAWHASTVPCSTCLAPNTSIAYQGTWHDGTHIIPTIDEDDLPTTTTPQPSPSGSNVVVNDDHKDADDGPDLDDEEEGEDKGKGKGKDKDDGGHAKRRSEALGAVGLMRRQDPSGDPNNNPFFTPHFDSDDAGFVDQPVSAQFNFSGSAIYVYALVPLAAAHLNSTPTFMNLTFLLDSHPSGTYQHIGTASAMGFAPSQLVFGRGDLSDGPHSLTIQIGPDSVLLLDYIVYTQGNTGGDGNNSSEAISPALGAPGARETGSGTGSRAPSGGPGTANLSAPAPKSNNIATFAGAVGGSVGLLAVLALSLAISIYRRRVRAARRDRQLRHARSVDFDGESFHTDASEDGPPMHGPAPFVPRYFPGTVVPAPPPPYSPPSEQTAALLAAATPVPSPLWAPPRIPAPGEDTSYADRPPPTPPPLPEDGLDDYFAPPSFRQAISSPIPAILAGYSPVTTSSVPVSSSPVPRHTNGPESRGVYATVPPTSRSRANSDAHSQRSDWSDRPPSFASQAPPLIPLPPQEGSHPEGEGSEGAQQEQRERTADGDRNSVRSARSR
ncbi:hypothetical protein OH77DRAFT_1430351 [Trametes cingulata]|nr:hypothetical protein OH77DRAFT_1430351 [Trametes cingulata]